MQATHQATLTPYQHIGVEKRDQWLQYMKMALEETVADVPLRDTLYAQFGDHMRNRGENTGCGHPVSHTAG